MMSGSRCATIRYVHQLISIRITEVEDLQAGAGTYLKSGVVSPMFRKAATILDMATAWNLESHIKDGYRFVMQNYHQGML
jgi:uncharacterized protein (DUF2235 family)